MPLVNNKVGDDATDGRSQAAVDEQALVGSLMKVVACFRHLASCVGGCTDTLQLRDELRQTREKAHSLAVVCGQRLTSRLRDKSLPAEERKKMELLWVAFSSSLELLHADLCKVFGMAQVFSLTNTHAFVQTGIQGGGSEVAARALSLPDLHVVGQSPTLPDTLETQETCVMEQEIGLMDRMIEDMELKVNVLRWTVEPLGGGAGGGSPEAGEPLSFSDSISMALLSLQEDGEEHGGMSPSRRLAVMALMLSGVLAAVTTLCTCIVLFS